MKGANKTRALLLAVLAATACGGGGGGTSATPDAWRLVLNHALEDLIIPLDAMNVFLVEDESYPEYFSIEGSGVFLAGELPAGLHVGSDEDWKALFGKTIVISPRGGDPADPQDSFVEMSDGRRARVAGGTVVFDKLSGKTSGRDGDMTLSGRVLLIVESGGGVQNLMGTIAVHCVTWG
jgi:hypothetical protein